MPHTPGPWSIEENSYRGTNLSIWTRHHLPSKIATVPVHPTDPGRDWANARLIAAAPDLFEALKHLLEDALAMGIDEGACCGVVHEARNAIRKAEGPPRPEDKKESIKERTNPMTEHQQPYEDLAGIPRKVLRYKCGKCGRRVAASQMRVGPRPTYKWICARCAHAEEVYAGYVQDADGNYFVQLPAENTWGFTICDEDQSWPGGFGGPRSPWTLIDPKNVPAHVRESLGSILDEYEAEDR